MLDSCKPSICIFASLPLVSLARFYCIGKHSVVQPACIDQFSGLRP